MTQTTLPSAVRNMPAISSRKFLAARFLLAFPLLVVLTLSTTGDICGEEFPVSNAAEIKTILPSLKPGDTVVMTNGTWTNQQIEFAAIGSKQSPITLRAQTAGLVILNGDSKLKISGDWLVVDGLRFDGGALKKGSIVQFRGSRGDATNSRFTNSSILNYNPPDMDTRYFWVSINGKSNRVDHNYFHNQNHSGVTVVVWRDKPELDLHRIDHNQFTDRPKGNGNGFETIRIGTSDESLSESRSVIESNLFERTDGEMEIISNKSCGNVYQYNTFSECAGTLTLRHGNNTLVKGNFFLGRGKERTGGVRVVGENQILVNNYFAGLTGRADGVISIIAGIPDTPLNGYSQVKNSVIAHNTIVDFSKAAIVFSQGLGARKRTLLPENMTIANNVIYSNQDPLFEGEQGSNWKWQGNIAFGQSLGSIEGNPGIKVVDPQLEQDEKGIWRPKTGSPLIDHAVGDYAALVKLDMDGQDRVDVFDIGADEFSTEPIKRTELTGTDVGPPLVVLLSQEDTANGKTIFKATVVRNKNHSEDLEVVITSSDEGALRTPATVTIPANEASVDFTVTVIDNKRVAGSQPVTISATSNGYPPGTATMSTEDNND